MDRDKVDVSSEIVLTRKKSEVFRFFRGVFFSRASAHITGMQRTKREAKNKERSKEQREQRARQSAGNLDSAAMAS